MDAGLLLVPKLRSHARTSVDASSHRVSGSACVCQEPNPVDPASTGSWPRCTDRRPRPRPLPHDRNRAVAGTQIVTSRRMLPGDSRSAAAGPCVGARVAMRACGQRSTRPSKQTVRASVRDALVAECGAGKAACSIAALHRQLSGRSFSRPVAGLRQPAHVAASRRGCFINVGGGVDGGGWPA